MDDGIALLCSLFPASEDKQKRVLDLLANGARNYYQQPKAKCTTWSYYTPFPPISGQLVIGGLEIYTSKAGLADQVNDKEFFQSFHETVKQEGLYSKNEELLAYYFAAGFIARKDHAMPFGGGTLISQTRFICKDKAAVLHALEDFIRFVRDEEPFVLTYAAFERKKNPKELLLFVRYRDTDGLRRHSRAPEHTDIVTKLSGLLENDITKETTIWKEVEDSFVSTQVGGPKSSSKL
ncbi:uncharacterized protein RCC_02636 [Ramularia collo-cygni]|uniref:ABM domain-containing protein n=1 Tax=Ramularia collo-cygni TaxID=112498 RepID=A0A2D3UMQ6_9PEZI|nr:uncharacterized protein RCC_02636 [Ramularia collo-cygni]CZT16802.1 uncharacterized protein RCC_02636 [Ramularia collo-cygni]